MLAYTHGLLNAFTRKPFVPFPRSPVALRPLVSDITHNTLDCLQQNDIRSHFRLNLYVRQEVDVRYHQTLEGLEVGTLSVAFISQYIYIKVGLI